MLICYKRCYNCGGAIQVSTETFHRTLGVRMWCSNECVEDSKRDNAIEHHLATLQRIKNGITTHAD